MKTEVNFTEAFSENINLKLINSKSYKKLYPFLVAAFLISYFLSAVFTLPFDLIIILIALNILIPVFMVIYSKNFKETGRLSIDLRNIIMVQNLRQPLIIPISMLEDFKISRGSTVHIEQKGIYSSETHDNWISFTFNKKPYKLEFCIVNEEENENFEIMINRLRAAYPKFYFESI